MTPGTIIIALALAVIIFFIVNLPAEAAAGMVAAAVP